MMENLSKAKILIIIPAYNEEKSIANTLSDLKPLTKLSPNINICVINDGSTDQTAHIVKTFPVILVNLPYNLGIGATVQTGYKYAHFHNYDIAVQFDADGQHSGQDLEDLIQPLLRNECDMVIGSRFIKKTAYKGCWRRRTGILFFSYLLGLLTGKKVTDPTSGYRAINRTALKLLALSYPKDYPEAEIIAYLHKKGLRCQEISVNMNPRLEGKSSITPFKSVYYMVKVTLSILVQKLTKEA